ncbi:hypothetical protein [Pseudactinotalea sp. HY158]|uniref:hypothetical protein n=1 Tax=Pseudactinotalea sp. HY158 TaxID=2654547 RepID=UPI00129D0F20|nr:hypothetical protein [Pseudactinotalea sp. HY158]QGH68564.1 hypothetical protein GCE65_02845 [Pseudactinotalea sp. HY158]
MDNMKRFLELTVEYAAAKQASQVSRSTPLERTPDLVAAEAADLFEVMVAGTSAPK